MATHPEDLESSNEKLDIKIELHFMTDNGVPSHLLIWMINRVSQAIAYAEEQEFESILNEFGHWSSLKHDAMRYRFNRHNRDSLFNIEYGGKGSLLLIGVASALAYWVADKTIGETVKDAWIESDGHAKLKEFLKTRVFAKRSKIARRIHSDYYSHRLEP